MRLRSNLSRKKHSNDAVSLKCVTCCHNASRSYATLSNLNEMGLIAVLMHASVAALYQRFDYNTIVQATIQQKSVP